MTEPDPLHDALRLDPVWRYFRDLASPGHRRVFESTVPLQCIDAMQRAGKTTVMVMEAAAYFRGIHPTRPRTYPARILVIAPSRAQLATIYRKRLLEMSEVRVPDALLAEEPDTECLGRRPLIPLEELKLRGDGKTADITWTQSPQGKSPGCIRHVDGTEMYFHISGDPRSWMRIEGMDFHAIFRDEAMGDDNIGNTLVTRLMDHWNRPDEPFAGFYKWGATELIVSQERIDFKKRCAAFEPNHELVILETTDNPAITQETREQAAGAMSGEEAAKRVWGTAGAVAATLIHGKHFSRTRHVLPEVYEPSPLANLWAIWDPGLRHPFGLLCGAIEPDRPFQLRTVRFYSEARRTLDAQANLLAQWLDGRALEGFIYDASGASKSDYSRGEALFTQFEDLLRRLGVKIHRGFQPAKNRYEFSLPMLWRYLDPDPSNPQAEPLIAINPPCPEAPGCEMAIEQMMTYRWKTGADGRLRGENVHKVNDEYPDCLRYWCSREPKWVKREPQHPRHAPMALAKVPMMRALPADPFATTPDMDPEIRLHRERLRASARMAATLGGTKSRSLPEVRVRGL